MILTVSIAFLALVIGSVAGAYVITVHLRAIYRDNIEAETDNLRADVKRQRGELAAMADKVQQVNDSTVLALEDLRSYVSQRYHRAMAAESRVKKKELEEEEEARYQAELRAALGYDTEDETDEQQKKQPPKPLIRR